MNPGAKYKPFPVIDLPDRVWPSRKITKPPIWCSVDLRDGNQSLPVPMTVSQKIDMFGALVRCGFKEIEVGFPAASNTEFDFVRRLIEDDLIPDDVTIQVLVQARKELIDRTVDSIMGARKVIIHLYNSTSPVQRRVVFGKEKPEIVDVAVEGAKWVKEFSKRLQGTEVRFEYSPESFSATELDFSLEICEAVIDVWKPTLEHKMIINLPCTVEVATPNVYSDQIEWMCRNISRRDSIIISIHTHNDRGTGVASTELGMLAGADRVEGTLFGNGERTGNLDIITVALNMYTQGIDPKLDFSDVPSLAKVYMKCTGMAVPQRQPYTGELVFTAFSGSHQDAIRKGMHARDEGGGEVWDVPYLAIDPTDIGQRYRLIRVNGQSGKGGVGYLLENECGIHMPNGMLLEFGQTAGKMIDEVGREVTSTCLKEMFWSEYVDRHGPYKLISFKSTDTEMGCSVVAVVSYGESVFELRGCGNGPIDAFVKCLRVAGIISVQVLNQAQHSLSIGEESSAIGYVQLGLPDQTVRWGAGVDASVSRASVSAVISAINRR